MKLSITNLQIIIIILFACLCSLGYVIYMIPINESMSTRDKIKQRMALRSETKKIEDTRMPEINASPVMNANIMDVASRLGPPELNNKSIKIVDKYGNISYAVVSTTLGNPTFYEPGTYRYGSAVYLPTYEDSVFLSKSLNPYSMFKKNDINFKNYDVIDMNNNNKYNIYNSNDNDKTKTPDTPENKVNPEIKPETSDTPEDKIKAENKAKTQSKLRNYKAKKSKK